MLLEEQNRLGQCQLQQDHPTCIANVHNAVQRLMKTAMHAPSSCAADGSNA